MKFLQILVVFCFWLLDFMRINVFSFQQYNAGDVAPSFSMQTLDGRLVYKEKISSNITPSNPIIFSAFTNHSAFLRALWTEEGSVRHLLERSPKNTQYIFISLADNAKDDVKYMRGKIFEEMEKLYYEKKDKYVRSNKSADQGILQNDVLFKRGKISTSRYLKKRELANDMQGSLTSSKKPFLKTSQHLKLFDSKHSGESELVNWKKHFHFASFPLFTFGNWIPFVMARWPCFGTGCGLMQVAFKSNKGEILQVVPRLEARYDWQPAPFKSLSKAQKTRLRYLGNACHLIGKKIKNGHKEVAMVSSEGHCTIFEKIQNVAKTGIKFVLIYAKKDEPLTEIKCHKQECYDLLDASASMISFESGEKARDIMTKQELYVEFQTTSQDNYFFAIDHRGRLAEMGLFLYPSLQFLAYEAQWFHYEADLMKNTNGHAKVISLFNHTLMQGINGAVKNITIPKDFLMYRNVELDMSLYCPQSYDLSCPHWDHVVHLTVCCEENRELCGAELGRWITPYARSIGRWLTPITSLLPLITSSTCTFTVKTVPWEMPWSPTLSIRFSDHILDSMDGYSKKRYSPDFIPYKALKLFQGGEYDKKYNRRYKPMKFYLPQWTKKVELVAIITGHGKDNHGCAEFCVTSHHFLFNEHSENVKVFKNAATAMGCAERVEQGVAPNEHGTWLYGRDGWCPGQEVVPWVVDVTKQVNLRKHNTVKYFSYFNGSNPNPKHSPGNIDMSSYLVFYRLASDLF